MDTAYSIWILFLVHNLIEVESEYMHLSSNETEDDSSKGRQLTWLLYSSINCKSTTSLCMLNFFFKDHTSIMTEPQFPDMKLPHLKINLY